MDAVTGIFGSREWDDRPNSLHHDPNLRGAYLQVLADPQRAPSCAPLPNQPSAAVVVT